MRFRSRFLNTRGTLSGEGKIFSRRIVARLRRDYQLKPRCDHLREKGLLTIALALHPQRQRPHPTIAGPQLRRRRSLRQKPLLHFMQTFNRSRSFVLNTSISCSLIQPVCRF
jgi:hypothetical protein